MHGAMIGQHGDFKTRLPVKVNSGDTLVSSVAFFETKNGGAIDSISMSPQTYIVYVMAQIVQNR